MSPLRRASTICLVRDADVPEVLMVRRPSTSRFMPGAWVFPGGAVDHADADPPQGFGGADDWVVAALREMIEETGIWLTTDGVIERPLTEHAFEDVVDAGTTLDPGALVYFANWITPEVFPVRFDTRFYLAVAPPSVEGAVDGDELVDLEWIPPMEALRREAAGAWDVAFPTRKILEMLATEATASDLENTLRALRIVPPIQPRLHVTEAEARIVMPHEDLFDDIADEQRDPDLLERLARFVERGGAVPAEFKGR
jgi:8-oxo-dGTP pyrophosphatase MutT (NUDIX family)